MALSVWPASLPYRPLRAPYDMPRRYAPAIVTEPEDGPARLRNTSSSTWTQLAYQLRLSFSEFDVADAFVLNDLAKGTARFMMPVGRPSMPDPWPPKLVYLEGGIWKAKPYGVGRMVASFTLNVLDW